MEVVVSRFVSSLETLGSVFLGLLLWGGQCYAAVADWVYSMSLIIVSNSTRALHDYSWQIQRVDLRETAETFSTSGNEPSH